MSVPSRARRLLVALLAVVVTAVTLTVPAAAEGTGRIAVHVVGTSGEPVAGVPITVYYEAPLVNDVATGVTDAQGHVDLDVPEGQGDFYVRNGSGRGSQFHPSAGTVIHGVAAGSVTEVEHVVTRTSSLKGRILGPDGQPQRGVQVLAEDSSNKTWVSSHSAADGTWIVTRPLRSGTYSVSPVDGTMDRFHVGPAAPHVVELREGETIQVPDFRLQPAGAAVGRVVDESGRPVANAQIHVYEPTPLEPYDRYLGGAPTLEDGLFDVKHVKPGSWELHVTQQSSGASYVNRSGTAFVAGKDAQLGDIVVRTKPTLIEKPTISGDVRVGSTLTVSPGEWSKDDLDFDYQWKVEGELMVVSNESTYVPTPDTVGRRVWVDVVAFKEFGPRNGVTTEKTEPVQPAPTGKVQSVDPPVITGTPRIGSPLKASSGTWSPNGTSHRYQWYMDGVALDAGKQASYTPSPGTLGKHLTVKVTASRTGFTAASRTSAATAVVAPGQVEVLRAPSLARAEHPVVGTSLGVDLGYWTPSGLTWSYVWVRDGVAIPSSTLGSRSSRYTLTSADWGKNVAVRVSGERYGFGVQRRYTESVYVKRKPSMSNTTEVLGGGKVRLTAKVVVVGATNPVGAVKVLEDGEEVATMPTMVKGVSSLVLSGRTPGVHTYTLAYEGNRLVVPASRERTVTVR